MSVLSRGVDDAILLAGVQRARLAPSVHNTQPWQFHLVDGALELHLDRSRALTSIDAHHRELTLSCGAALLHLRVALEAGGARTHVVTFPFTDRPEVLARITLASLGEPDPLAVALDAVVEDRQTNRRPYLGGVDATSAVLLEAAATLEGAGLQAVTDEDDQTNVKVWQQEADAAQRANKAYREELRSWVGRSRTEDGIPLASTSQPSRGPHDFAARDFALGATGAIPEGEDDSGASYFVLFTDDDEPADWLAAGQALARIWLEATRLGLVVQPLSQSVEDAVSRLHLRSDLRLLRCWPQLLLRVGRAEAQPRTPRRSLQSIVVVDDEPAHAAGHRGDVRPWDEPATAGP